MLAETIDWAKSRLQQPYKNWPRPELPPHSVLALCQSASEVKYIAGTNLLKVDAIVALTPQAASQCYTMGLSYLKLEDFFDVTALNKTIPLCSIGWPPE